MSDDSIDQNKGYKMVYSTATYYRDSIRIYTPFTPYSKQTDNQGESIDDAPTLSKRASTGAHSNQSEEEDAERSIRRTKKLVSDYVKTNTFDLFATFTFKDNRHDIDSCKQRMADWLKNQKKRKGSFEYILVPEFHKDGALHFHALLKDYPGDLTPAINSKTGKPILNKDQPVFNIDSYTLGFNTAKQIVQTSESLGKVGNYLTKYVTKDMPRLSGQNRYWVSHGLKKPIVIDNPDKPQQRSYHTILVDQGILRYYKYPEGSDE